MRRCAFISLLLCSALLLAQTPRRGPKKIQKASAIQQSPPLFTLWEKQADLRHRLGVPPEYFVPRIQKLIRPAQYDYYFDNYKNVDDVFYRPTSLGEVRILIAYAVDGSRSHLNPEIRVSKVHFVFDKDVALRDALSSIAELRQLCAEGCILNGFTSNVVVQPAAPTEGQLELAKEMKPLWRGQDMSDATPGAEVFYQDSPYPIDFEHSPVERIDLTLVSNAARERYALTVMNTHATILDEWRPHRRQPHAAPGEPESQ
ncbi:MAG TPA: hypothetical protein VFL42_08095 [Terriglobales bacterium]|jgi:hypothetical protein|nr:hypothetical protein [Terriglobales bacterium]